MAARVLVALLAATLALAACGGEDGSDEDRIRAVAADYLAAMATADGDALCSAASETQQAKILLGARIYDQEGEDCAAVVDAAGEPLGAEDLEAMAEDMDGARVTIEDSVAVVQLPNVSEGSGGMGPYALYAVDEDGEWKVDELQ